MIFSDLYRACYLHKRDVLVPLVTLVTFGSLTASSFPRHSITSLTLNQSKCRVMKQEIVRKRNESISTIIIFICSSLGRPARQRQQQMNVLPIFFAICWRTSDDFYSLSAWYRGRCSNLPSGRSIVEQF